MVIHYKSQSRTNSICILFQTTEKYTTTETQFEDPSTEKLFSTKLGEKSVKLPVEETERSFTSDDYQDKEDSQDGQDEPEEEREDLLT